MFCGATFCMYNIFVLSAVLSVSLSKEEKIILPEHSRDKCFAVPRSARYNDARYRGVAQLVARDIWDVEVACSNHVAPIGEPDRAICPVFGF